MSSQSRHLHYIYCSNLHQVALISTRLNQTAQTGTKRNQSVPSCTFTARDISRFHSVMFCAGHRYNVKSQLSNLESKNTSFVNISSSFHLMLLLMASACSLTLIVLSISAKGKLFKVWATRPKNSAKVSCVIYWSNRSR